ncbi:MAG: hypothetical protein ACR2NA_08035 [Solirubrobacterales bacterium]
MALIVWFTVGLALWHFTVFLPEADYRFWGGIVGALLAGAAGAMLTGLIWMLITGDGVGETNLLTALAAVPGSIGGLALGYWYGWRAETQALEAEA